MREFDPIAKVEITERLEYARKESWSISQHFRQVFLLQYCMLPVFPGIHIHYIPPQSLRLLGDD